MKSSSALFPVSLFKAETWDDFNEDVYGHHVTVSFYQYVRKEKSFDNLEELKLQIHSDEKDIRTFFTASID